MGELSSSFDSLVEIFSNEKTKSRSPLLSVPNQANPSSNSSSERKFFKNRAKEESIVLPSYGKDVITKKRCINIGEEADTTSTGTEDSGPDPFIFVPSQTPKSSGSKVKRKKVERKKGKTINTASTTKLPIISKSKSSSTPAAATSDSNVCKPAQFLSVDVKINAPAPLSPRKTKNVANLVSETSNVKSVEELKKLKSSSSIGVVTAREKENCIGTNENIFSNSNPVNPENKKSFIVSEQQDANFENPDVKKFQTVPKVSQDCRDNSRTTSLQSGNPNETMHSLSKKLDDNIENLSMDCENVSFDILPPKSVEPKAAEDLSIIAATKSPNRVEEFSLKPIDITSNNFINSEDKRDVVKKTDYRKLGQGSCPLQLLALNVTTLRNNRSCYGLNQHQQQYISVTSPRGASGFDSRPRYNVYLTSSSTANNKRVFPIQDSGRFQVTNIDTKNSQSFQPMDLSVQKVTAYPVHAKNKSISGLQFALPIDFSMKLAI